MEQIDLRSAKSIIENMKKIMRGNTDMTNKKISFTAVHKAEIVESEVRELKPNEVMTETARTSLRRQPCG